MGTGPHGTSGKAPWTMDLAARKNINMLKRGIGRGEAAILVVLSAKESHLISGRKQSRRG